MKTSTPQFSLILRVPANTITIERVSNEVIPYSIINSVGTTIRSGSLHEMKSEVAISDLQNGYYTLVLDGKAPIRFVVVK